jgi:hypothetical protein
MNVIQKGTALVAMCILWLTLTFLGGCGSSSTSSVPSAPIPASVLATIPLGLSSAAVDVNSTTNRIYVANLNDQSIAAESVAICGIR